MATKTAKKVSIDTKIRAGTSGYSYKEWRGPFYPDDLPQDQWLTYYSEQLPTVEINNTFYRMPKDHVVAAWRDAVPDNFKFVIKASRRITHQHRLNNADEATGYLIKRTDVLGDKLGVVLFQLPPNMRLNLERFEQFLELLPAGYPSAFEFRHESWNTPEVDALLHKFGAAKVISHDDPSAPVEVPPATRVYLRLRGSHYSPAMLKKWYQAAAIATAEEAFVFFKHEDDGAGPKMAQQFLKSGQPAQPKRAPRRTAQSGQRKSKA